MDKEQVLEKLKGKLIVSCQALEDEPLHSSYIMSRMAYAAEEGGAGGIRANSVEDIMAIKKAVSVPVIGIVKKVYPGCEVYITPTRKEVDALIACGCEMIALDATQRVRPDNRELADFFAEIRAAYPGQLFMADCSNLEEGLYADELGFDIISTTLCGYTPYTMNLVPPVLELMKDLVKKCSKPVIAEGGIWSPDDLGQVMQTGVFAAVIGTAITRPREITGRFVETMLRYGRPDAAG